MPERFWRHLCLGLEDVKDWLLLVERRAIVAVLMWRRTLRAAYRAARAEIERG